MTRLCACLGPLAATIGCTHDRPLEVRLGNNVRLPHRAAVLFLVDGLDRTRMEEMVAGAELPNIRKRLLDRGTVVQNAVTALPSITYPNTTSLLTGQYPGTHGILGNKWFDRYRLVLHDYTTTRTYRDTDADFRVPTIYETLPETTTASVQCAVRRGATRIIDNWATSGINWFFGGFNEVDKLVAMRFELIADMARRTGRWPAFVNAYFPGVDETGHQYGADSPQYRRSLRNLDAQIGRILDAYERIGLGDQTYFVLTSDHGHVPIVPARRLDVAAWLRKHAALRVTTTDPGGSYEDRYVRMQTVDAVVVNGGNRRAAIHLRGPGGWHDRPTADRTRNVLGRAAGLWNDPRVALVAIRVDDGAVLVASRGGTAVISRHPARGGEDAVYALIIEAGDPLGYLAEGLSESVSSGPHNSRSWLQVTAGAAFPDFVPQIVEMFDSPNAGDVIVFAADGADFGRSNRGGHGSALRRDMIVPMIWRGPDIPAGGRIDAARTVDVMPTLLELLGVPVHLDLAAKTDGQSLADQLRSAPAN